MGNATTSTTITFVTSTAGDGDGNISVELDDAANNDKSQFASGDTVHYLVHTDPIDMTVSNTPSSGSVAANGTKQVTVTKTVTFAKSTTSRLDKVPTGTVTWSWIGRDGGAPTFAGADITLAAAAVGVLQCTYPTTAKAFALSGVTIPAGLDEFPVVVVVEEAAA